MGSNNEFDNEIFISEEEGFTDVVTVIKEAVKNSKRYLIKCGGIFEGEETEVTIDLPEMFEAGIVGNEVNERAFTKGFLLLEGKKGKNFAKMFSNVYKIEHEELELQDIKKPVVVFPLMEKRSSIESETVFTKIFFDQNNEKDEYCELFLNISLEDKIIEFNEKDNEYRTNIIKNLMK